jgi:UDP-N-acetyl-2-amino-2-deoxyglucuronate dehydrogenase
LIFLKNSPFLSKQISFGIIGLGHIGRRHAEVLQGHAQTRLLAAADPADMTLNGCVVYKDAREMLEIHPEIEIVVVSVPNGWHEKYALLALEYGKHVVIEKPMALSKAACERILHTSLQKQRQVYGVMQLRYAPLAQWAREIIASGRLGNVFLAQAHCFWNRDDRYYTPGSWHGSREMDGGPLFTQFSHFVDFLYWTLGDLTLQNASLHNFTHQHSIEFEDTGSFQFRFGQNGLGIFTYTTAVWDKNFESSVTFIGEKGTLKLSGQYLDTVQYFHTVAGDVPPEHRASPIALHYALIDNVVKSLTEGEKITTNALESLKVVEFIEKVTH